MKTFVTRFRAGKGYKWWVLGMIMIGTFMAVLDITVVNVGMPAIMGAFRVGISTAEWVITAYMITMTLMLPTAGWLADKFGNKRVYIVGMFLFTLGSWLCGRAWTLTEWNLERAVAAIADVVRTEGVERIVLGLPKNMDGTEGPRAEKSRAVARLLTEATGLEVVLWDERRSSIEAHGILHANGRKEKKHRQTVDAVAASLILEGYLGTLR